MTLELIMIHVLSVILLFMLGYFIGMIQTDKQWIEIRRYERKQREEARRKAFETKTPMGF